MTLRAGDPLPYWQTTPMVEARYDVPDSPMQGEMDSTFFLTKDKNYIPHTYPCRTAYIAAFRDKEPVPGFAPDLVAAQNILPMGAAFLDLSGFWFRATRLCNWQRTAVHAASAGPARLRRGKAVRERAGGRLAGPDDPQCDDQGRIRRDPARRP